MKSEAQISERSEITRDNPLRLLKSRNITMDVVFIIATAIVLIVLIEYFAINIPYYVFLTTIALYYLISTALRKKP